jgi:hypothetical protein
MRGPSTKDVRLCGGRKRTPRGYDALPLRDLLQEQSASSDAPPPAYSRADPGITGASITGSVSSAAPDTRHISTITKASLVPALKVWKSSKNIWEETEKSIKIHDSNHSRRSCLRELKDLWEEAESELKSKLGKASTNVTQADAMALAPEIGCSEAESVDVGVLYNTGKSAHDLTEYAKENSARAMKDLLARAAGQIYRRV